MFKLLSAVLALASCLAARAQVFVPVMPEKDGPEASALYRVELRPKKGQTWQSVPVIRCDVNTRRVQQAAFAEWDMDEPVELRIVRRRALGKRCPVVVRPASRGIVPKVIDDSTVTLTLERPEFLSVEFDGDRLHNLHLLANPVLAERHTPSEPRSIDWVGERSQDVFVRHPRLIYFGPGVHRPKDLPSAEIRIPSNCTVYLAPGAVVKARLIVDHAENVRIVGRGIVDHPLRGVEITYSRNVLVEGLTFLNPAHYTVYGGESTDITVRGIKSFSARPWSDGIDLMCCRRVRIEHCFLRTSDDCIALYNHRWWFWGGSQDIVARGCVLWPDAAHSVNIGSHGDDRNPEGETLRDVLIEDCDVLQGIDGHGLLAVNCGDINHIRNVRFEDIRCEGISEARLFDLRVLFSPKYNRAPGCCVDSVSFSRIRVDEASAARMSASHVSDYDSAHSVRRWFLNDVRLGKRSFDPERDVVRLQREKGE
ncbi:MAG: glycoside hydrolase [Bacteroidaceae bacterium]|nr:glycoside hydrolase [Bacteroidaceae bacterium]